jgi:prefoldin subunit 5
LVKAISAEFKGDWERQSIAKYPHLQREFQKTQERIRKAQRDEKAGRRVSRTRDEQIEFFKRQIELLNRENADLKKQLAEAETRLAKWRHNALMHRITVRMLDQPMQENDRGRSDKA